MSSSNEQSNTASAAPSSLSPSATTAVVPGAATKEDESSTESDLLQPLTEAEELELYDSLAKTAKSPFVARLKRKLALRQFKRKSNLPIFNLDDQLQKCHARSQKSDQRLAQYYPDFFRQRAPPPAPPPTSPSPKTTAAFSSSPMNSPTSAPSFAGRPNGTPSSQMKPVSAPSKPSSITSLRSAVSSSVSAAPPQVIIAPDLNDPQPVSKVMPSLAALLSGSTPQRGGGGDATIVALPPVAPHRVFSKRQLDDERDNLIVAEEQLAKRPLFHVRTQQKVALRSISDIPSTSPLAPPTTLVHPLSFAATLSGCSENSDRPLLQSPCTLRTLKTFIRRDTETITPQMALLTDIRRRFNPQADSYPIDYLYMRPQFLNRVNQLLQQHFWPGIDVQEWCDFPEYSVVCMYRQPVTGAGFISPDGYVSYLVVRPEWRQAGIARFMLYHLIQTCTGKDITLHVAASNPAMILYQKFGFKPEEFMLKFYEKYLPENSKECKHAFFLRLRR